MTDFSTAGFAKGKGLRLPGLRILGSAGALVVEIGRAVGSAFALAYAEPFRRTPRGTDPEIGADGRDPRW